MIRFNEVEDLLLLVKKAMRNVWSLTNALDQMRNLIDFVTTAEPLLKESAPQWIAWLHQPEQKGAFALLRTAGNVAEKMAQTYSQKDIEQIGDGLVRSVGVAKKLTSPAAEVFLDKAAEVPLRIDLSGRTGHAMEAAVDPRRRGTQSGFGGALELTRALAAFKA